RTAAGERAPEGAGRDADGERDAEHDAHARAHGHGELRGQHGRVRVRPALLRHPLIAPPGWGRDRPDLTPSVRTSHHGREGRMVRAPRMRLFGALCFMVLLGTAAAPPDSPVADAAMRSDAEAVRALIRQGADVNAAQGDGMTAPHWAARNGDAPLIKMLVYAGASPRAATRVGGFTPLHLASRAGKAAAVVALLESGSDPNVTTTSGGQVTPLHFAVASGSVETVAALLDRGADIDARETSLEQTPLMWAAAYNRVPVLHLLLQRGAD